ncbi:MAG: transcription termination/antitermination protein NusG [Planctomycetota bacterium]
MAEEELKDELNQPASSQESREGSAAISGTSEPATDSLGGNGEVEKSDEVARENSGMKTAGDDPTAGGEGDQLNVSSESTSPEAASVEKETGGQEEPANDHESENTAEAVIEEVESDASTTEENPIEEAVLGSAPEAVTEGVEAEDEGGGVENGDTESSADEDEEEFEEEELNEFGFSAADMVDDDDDDELVDDEDVSPIEEFVDEAVVVDDGEEVTMDWYILKVQVNRENSICDTLKRRVKVAGMDRYFGEVLVPTEDVREFTKAGKQRIVKRKLYPGYIVVNMSINDDSWFLVRETSGIGDFTGAAGKPTPLSSDEISRIVASARPEEEEEGEENIKTAIPFKVSDRVRVKEGYFQNHEGDVSNVDERNGRITVMINIFGRPNPVELDHWHVEKV